MIFAVVLLAFKESLIVEETKKSNTVLEVWDIQALMIKSRHL